MTLSKTLFTGRQPTLKFQCEQCGVKVEEEAATQSTQFLYKAIWMPQTSIVLVSINNEDVGLWQIILNVVISQMASTISVAAVSLHLMFVLPIKDLWVWCHKKNLELEIVVIKGCSDLFFFLPGFTRMYKFRYEQVRGIQYENIIHGLYCVSRHYIVFTIKQYILYIVICQTHNAVRLQTDKFEHFSVGYYICRMI